VFLFAINVLLLLLGCLLDATTLILVIVPLFIPACRHSASTSCISAWSRWSTA
jgi:TRAP-type C4-dicarboxylate transport system permease large subunit